MRSGSKHFFLSGFYNFSITKKKYSETIAPGFILRITFSSPQLEAVYAVTEISVSL